ncbi:MAG: TIGR01777 family oxidoreductase [Acidobacteriota bacterium]
MRILVTGSSGMVGSALVQRFQREGHQVCRLIRTDRPVRGEALLWDPAAGVLDNATVADFAAVVHLAGASIAAKRWSPSQMNRITESRVKGTQLISRHLARLSAPPGTLVIASAVGYYGDRGEEILDEDASAGRGFLARVCRQWEAAAEPAREAGIRVVHLRFGMILSRHGGALKTMLLPFRLGLGGRVGSGRQYMSWVSLTDALRVIQRVLTDRTIQGPVNVVTPHPVRNLEFARLLGRVLRRPAFLPLPATAARLLLGRMADELLLASTRVRPARLTAVGFRFRHEELEAALRYILDQS